MTGCAASPTVNPHGLTGETITPSPSQESPTATPMATLENKTKLVIWVPAQFDPNSKTEPMVVLAEALTGFEADHPGLSVEIRVKAETGPSGLMETLGMASITAPDAMPTLVLLSRGQMEEAARKGIIFPYEGLTTVLDEKDWYSFAKELAVYNGDIYGLPNTGNALTLISRGNYSATQAPTWEEIQKIGISVSFAAADPQAAIPLALYRSAGGTTDNINSSQQIQLNELELMLSLLNTGAEKNIFPPWLINYQTDDQVMDTFSNQQTGWAITWLTTYLAVRPENTHLYPVPSIGSKSATFASGMVWALTDTNPERRQLSVDLAEHLVSSEFLSLWNLANNTLPTRPSALTTWPDSSLRNELNQVALAAEIRPSVDILTALGPAIQEAVILILKRQSDPVKAAQTVVQRLSAPVSK